MIGEQRRDLGHAMHEEKRGEHESDFDRDREIEHDGQGEGEEKHDSIMPATGHRPPDRTLVAVRASAPVAGKPPKSAEAMLAAPCATSSQLERCRLPIMPSATTADSSNSTPAKKAMVKALGNSSRVFLTPPTSLTGARHDPRLPRIWMRWRPTRSSTRRNWPIYRRSRPAIRTRSRYSLHSAAVGGIPINALPLRRTRDNTLRGMVFITLSRH